MRVLAVLSGLELFGHELGNIEVFKALRSMGASVRVGVDARDDGGEVAKALREGGFECFSLPMRPQWSLQWVRNEGPMYAVRQLLAVYKCSRIFKKEIQEFKPTHIHLGNTLAYSFISWALWRDKTPLIYRMGDCPPVDSPFNLRFWRLSMKRSSQVVANSKFVISQAVASGVEPERIRLIYNHAPTRVNDTGKAETVAPEESAILYVGSIAEHKGLRPLVEAFVQVADEFPSLKLWLVGGSRWGKGFSEALEHFIKQQDLEQRVRWMGQVDDPGPCYRKAAIHLTPSMWEEPGGNIVFEAKREGTPSIVFPSGGLPEAVRDHVDGIVCDEKSADCLAKAIREMLRNPQKLEAMGNAARKDYEQRFGWQRFVAEWAAVYGTVK